MDPRFAARRAHGKVQRTSSRWLRLALAAWIACLVSGVAHAAEEAVERAVGAADHGHLHTADVEHDDCVPEDDCFGLVHHCSCCAGSFAALSSDAFVFDPGVRVAARVAPHTGSGPPGVDERVERPPRR